MRIKSILHRVVPWLRVSPGGSRFKTPLRIPLDISVAQQFGPAFRSDILHTLGRTIAKSWNEIEILTWDKMSGWLPAYHCPLHCPLHFRCHISRPFSPKCCAHPGVFKLFPLKHWGTKGGRSLHLTVFHNLLYDKNKVLFSIHMNSLHKVLTEHYRYQGITTIVWCAYRVFGILPCCIRQVVPPVSNVPPSHARSKHYTNTLPSNDVDWDSYRLGFPKFGLQSTAIYLWESLAASWQALIDWILLILSYTIRNDLQDKGQGSWVKVQDSQVLMTTGL